MKLDTNVKILAGGAVLAMIAAWYIGSRIKNIKPAEVTAGVVGVAADAFAGFALGLGDEFGIPRTNVSECEKALREGRTWDASLACPSGTFIRSVFD